MYVHYALVRTKVNPYNFGMKKKTLKRKKLRGRFEMRLTKEQERFLIRKGWTRWVKQQLFEELK